MSVTKSVVEARERAATLLDRTRELFERTHWGQGTFYRNDEAKARFCAVGGIRYYVIGDPLAGLLETQAEHELADTVSASLGQGDGPAWDDDVPLDYDIAVRALALAIYPSDVVEELDHHEEIEEKIYEWNDDDHRQLADVLDAFRRASALAREVAV